MNLGLSGLSRGIGFRLAGICVKYQLSVLSIASFILYLSFSFYLFLHLSFCISSFASVILRPSFCICHVVSFILYLRFYISHFVSVILALPFCICHFFVCRCVCVCVPGVFWDLFMQSKQNQYVVGGRFLIYPGLKILMEQEFVNLSPSQSQSGLGG